MPRQTGVLLIRGTIGNTTYYKRNGKYYYWKKTSLNKDRISRDPAYAVFRENSALFAVAAKLSAHIRRYLSKAQQSGRNHCPIVKKIIFFLRQRISIKKIIREIFLQYGVLTKRIIAPAITPASVSATAMTNAKLMFINTNKTPSPNTQQPCAQFSVRCAPVSAAILQPQSSNNQTLFSHAYSPVLTVKSKLRKLLKKWLDASDIRSFIAPLRFQACVQQKDSVLSGRIPASPCLPVCSTAIQPSF